MRPEDVPADLVERAAQAAYAMHYEEARVWQEAEYDLPLDDEDWPEWDPQDGHFSEMLREQRHALAAVLPEIQAQALRDAADRLDDESGDPFREIAPLVRQNGSGLIGAVYGTAQWLRNRAARLTAATDRPTK